MKIADNVDQSNILNILIFLVINVMFVKTDLPSDLKIMLKHVNNVRKKTVKTVKEISLLVMFARRVTLSIKYLQKQEEC